MNRFLGPALRDGLLACGLATALLAASPCAAVEKTWIGGTGSWDLAANWDPAGVPVVGDAVVIPPGSDAISMPPRTGGLCYNAASVAVGAGATLLVDGTCFTIVEMLNRGTVEIVNTSGYWYSGFLNGSGTIVNEAGGAFRVRSGRFAIAFENRGTLVIDTPMTIHDPLTSSGALEVNANLTVDVDGEPLAFSGQIAIAPGVTLGLSDAVFTPTPGLQIGGGGRISLFYGWLDVGAGWTLDGLTVEVGNGGVIGSGALTIGPAGSLMLFGSTVRVPVANGGVVTSRQREAIFQGPVTNLPGGTIRSHLAESPAGYLTFSAGLENQGLIELAGIAVDGGPLRNLAGGRIVDVAGRYCSLAGALENQGEVVVAGSLSLRDVTNDGIVQVDGTLSIPSTATFTNRGSVTIAPGKSLRVAGTFRLEPASALAGEMTLGCSYSCMSRLVLGEDLATSDVNLLFDGASAIEGPGTLFNDRAEGFTLPGVRVEAPLVNAALLRLTGASTITGSFTTLPGSRLVLDGAAVTLPVCFTNLGTLEIGGPAGSGSGASLTCSAGTLSNEKGAGILFPAGAGERRVEAPLENRGTMASSADNAVLEGSLTAAEGSTLAVDAGRLHLARNFASDGRIDVTGATLVIAGGWQAGSGSMTSVAGATLRVLQAVTNEGTIAALDGTVDFWGKYLDAPGASLAVTGGGLAIGDNVTIRGRASLRSTTASLEGYLWVDAGATVSVSDARLLVAGFCTNEGRLTLAGAGGDAAPTLRCRGVPLLNAAGGVIDVPGGSGPRRVIEAQHLTNQGLVRVAHPLALLSPPAAGTAAQQSAAASGGRLYNQGRLDISAASLPPALAADAVILELGGSFGQISGGTLALEFGTAVPAFGHRFIATGPADGAALGGALVVAGVPEAFSSGETYAILTHPSREGSFASVRLPDERGDGRDLRLAYGTTATSLAVAGEPIRVLPSACTFDPTPAGATATPCELTVTAGPQRPLTLFGVVPVGGAARDFRVAPGGSAPCKSLFATLAAGASCTLAATFTPSASGPRGSRLRFLSNGGLTPWLEVPLAGTGAYTLQVGVSPEGGGTVEGPGILCPGVCQADFTDAVPAPRLVATPAPGHHFSRWIGAPDGAVETADFPLAGHGAVIARFAPNRDSYTVIASAGDGGRVSPAGALAVPAGGELLLEFAPDPGFHVHDVRVDGVSAGVPAGWRFGGVDDDHAVEVTFAPAVPETAAVACPETLTEGETADCTCTVTWSDGALTDESDAAAWSTDCGDLAVAAGALKAGVVDASRVCTVAAAFAFGGVTLRDESAVTLRNEPVIFADAFAFADPGAALDWTLASGGWAVLKRRFYAKGTKLDLAVAGAKGRPPPVIDAGRLRATVSLPPVAGAKFTLHFAYLDKARSRYVCFSPGKVVVGQSGAIDGKAAGVIRTATAAALVPGRAVPVQVDLLRDGRVAVKVNGKRVLATAFPRPFPGRVAIAAAATKAWVDDVVLKDASAYAPAPGPGH